MGKINASRVALGGIVAGVIFFVGDAVVNGAILKSQWSEALRVVGLGADDAFRNPSYFACYDLLKGCSRSGSIRRSERAWVPVPELLSSQL